MPDVLIKEKKYSGKYVAIKDLAKPTVIASGDDPAKVYKDALKKKCTEPTIIFVPAKNMVQIY